MFKKLVIPMIAAVHCISATSHAWQVKPEVSKAAAEIIQQRMVNPSKYIPQSQDATLQYTSARSTDINQVSTSVVDNDEEALQLIEETYQKLNKGKNNPFSSQDQEAILSNDAPLITFLGLTNGLIQLPDFYNTLKVYYNTNKLTFEQVITSISPDMENDFDAFIFINSGEGSHKIAQFPRGQRIKYFRRAVPGAPIFERNDNGQITGVQTQLIGNAIQTEAELAPYMNPAYLKRAMDQEGILTSTGISGGGGMRTFSGVYRVGRTEQVHGKGMIYTMFIDYQYMLNQTTAGKVSGIAIHGTPTGNVGRLGNRASHGCARIEPNLSGVMRSLMFNRSLSPGMSYTEGVAKFPKSGDGWNLQKQDLMDFNRYSQLPSPQEQVKDPSRVRPGYKALIILFDGYSNPGVAL
ncbi:L,D-transpeptidase [Bdellovibrio sp. HCB337]|uniref:L,D-transpeptidase n=1 Tax=Bdellovibrio sp. HCB337 TaxID=3394358 RepID=UPI0039A53B6B